MLDKHVPSHFIFKHQRSQLDLDLLSTKLQKSFEFCWFSVGL